MIDELKQNINTIIDASAGTGKTYTICEIVIDRIKKGYNIEEFIIMTFTDKAAGELISRIRKGIKDELSNPALLNNEKTNLQRALKNFDYATISTIHGFCKKILSEYAFECNIPYNQEVNNDNDFLKYAYGDITFKSLIDELKNLTNEDVKKIFSKNGKGFEDDILFKIANEINLPNDILLPIKDDFKYSVDPSKIDSLEKFYSVDFDKLKEHLLNQKTNPKSKEPQTTDQAKRLIEKLEPLFEYYKKNGIKDILNELSDFTITKTQEPYLTEFYKKYFNEALVHNIVYSNIDYLKNYSNYLLGCKTKIIEEVTKQYETIKKNNLTITFNDMIRLVANNLKDKESHLKSILQERYKIGIIDEFQDTSPAQWNIAKEIFLNRVKEDTHLPHHLIIVGDEKQSIYSFQGANVETYREAKRIMINDYGAQTVYLEYNYRTTKELLDCFNIIFSHKIGDNNFWFPYTPVKYPPKNGYDKKKYDDDTPLVIYPIKVENKNLKGNYPDFIVSEIKKNKDKGYSYSDICVLIRENKDANNLIKLFNKESIPFTQYNKKGLYNSLEANELFILLSALAFPYNKQYLKDLILTRFYPNYGLKSLNINDTELTEMEKELDTWREYFDKYGFYYMMRKIFEDKNIFSNIMTRNLFPENTLVEPDTAERSITNFNHIVKKLVDNGHKNNSILDYYNTFDDLRNHKGSDEDLQEIDTEKEKVQIMTMHASKGLEFKVVFIYGPFGWTRKTRYYYPITQTQNKIYSLDNDINENIKFENEEFNKKQNFKEICDNLDIDETKRLLYVAFTRAKDKLYLPFIKSTKEDPVKDNNYVKNVISESIKLLVDYKSNPKDYEDLNNSKIEDIKKLKYEVIFNNDSNEETNSKGDTKGCEDPEDSKPSSSESIPDFKPQENMEINDVSGDQRFVNSFSNRIGINFVKLGIIDEDEYKKLDLKENAYIEEVTASNEDPGIGHKPHGDNSEEINETEKEDDNKDIMPGGTKIGSMLHEIFEKIDFKKNVMSYDDYDHWKAEQEADSNEKYSIKKIIEKNGLSKKYKDNVYRMVWNTLHTSLSKKQNVLIGNIDKSFKEIQFDFKIKDKDKDKYLSGVIDMIFEFAGKIYILDWKSNKTPNGNYSNEDVENIMKEHAYKLQYALYKYAVNKWLKQNGINKEVAGGFYVFLRPAEKGNNAKVVELK